MILLGPTGSESNIMQHIEKKRNYVNTFSLVENWFDSPKVMDNYLEIQIIVTYITTIII